jgi:hypothetical protein
MTPPYIPLLGLSGRERAEEPSAARVPPACGRNRAARDLAEAEQSPASPRSCERTGKIHELSLSERLYRLDRVRRPVSRRSAPRRAEGHALSPQLDEAITDECSTSIRRWTLRA